MKVLNTICLKLIIVVVIITVIVIINLLDQPPEYLLNELNKIPEEKLFEIKKTIGIIFQEYYSTPEKRYFHIYFYK